MGGYDLAKNLPSEISGQNVSRLILGKNSIFISDILLKSNIKTHSNYRIAVWRINSFIDVEKQHDIESGV